MITQNRADLEPGLGVVRSECLKHDLYINVDKTKAMRFGSKDTHARFALGGSEVGVVHQFFYLGSLLTADNTSEAEITHLTGLGYGALDDLWKISWKSRDISIKTKLNALQTRVFSIVRYAAETWRLRKEELRRPHASR